MSRIIPTKPESARKIFPPLEVLIKDTLHLQIITRVKGKRRPTTCEYRLCGHDVSYCGSFVETSFAPHAK
jgi:hypothetical protein